MPLQDDDLLLVQRGNDLYRTTYGELKTQIANDLGLPFTDTQETTQTND